MPETPTTGYTVELPAGLRATFESEEAALHWARRQDRYRTINNETGRAFESRGMTLDPEL